MVDLDRRTYDLLRIVREHGPIGSIRLTELMQQRGYSIQDRTIRLTLLELDDSELTEKVPGRGRNLTEKGRRELERGNVFGRLERVRERIATLTSQVTYDPIDDTGDVISTAVTVTHDDVSAAFDRLEALSESDLGPIPTAVKDTESTTGAVQLLFPSSITLGGVLLTRGIDAPLETAGLVQYDPSAGNVDAGTGRNSRVIRYVDAINGEGSSMDVVSLLIEAGRTDVTTAVDNDGATLIVDNRQFPIVRLDEAVDITLATQNHLGGVPDIRRPRESGPFPGGQPNFDSASLTYGGSGELATALLAEGNLTNEWSILYGVEERASFRSPKDIRIEVSSSLED